MTGVEDCDASLIWQDRRQGLSTGRDCEYRIMNKPVAAECLATPSMRSAAKPKGMDESPATTAPLKSLAAVSFTCQAKF